MFIYIYIHINGIDTHYRLSLPEKRVYWVYYSLYTKDRNHPTTKKLKARRLDCKTCTCFVFLTRVYSPSPFNLCLDKFHKLSLHVPATHHPPSTGSWKIWKELSVAEAEDLDDCATRHGSWTSILDPVKPAVCREKPPSCPKNMADGSMGKNRSRDSYYLLYLRIHGMVDFFCCGRCIGRFCIFLWYQMCRTYRIVPCISHHGIVFSWIFSGFVLGGGPKIPPRFPKRKGIQLYFFGGPFWLDESPNISRT